MSGYYQRLLNTSPETYNTVPTFLFPLSAAYRALSFAAFITFAAAFILALHTIDFCYALSNAFLFFLPIKNYQPPPPFSPYNAPDMMKYPFAWILCKTCAILGKTLTPRWFWAYAHWGGVGSAAQGWGNAIAPQATDSRCPCPAINAMANHGIIPRNGRHITPEVLAAAVYRTYNLSPTLSVQLLAAFEPFYRGRGWFDLEDLGGQNIIQHDGSLLREDICSPNAKNMTPIECQAKPDKKLIDLYFPEKFGKTSLDKSASSKVYTYRDFGRILAHRRWFSWNTCGTFNLSPTQYVFSSGNMALIHQCVGGNMDMIRPWAGVGGHEMFPADYRPKPQQWWGMSILQLQYWTAVIELACGPLDKVRMAGALNDVDANGGAVYGAAATGVSVTSKKASLAAAPTTYTPTNPAPVPTK